MRRSAVGGYLAVVVPLAVATFALPRFHVVLWGLLGLTASAAVVVGAVRNRPERRVVWLLVAVALATFVTGDIVYDALTEIFHRSNPFPSVADAFTSSPILC